MFHVNSDVGTVSSLRGSWVRNVRITVSMRTLLPTVMCTYVRPVAAYVVTRTNTATISADDIRTQK